jgi:RNA polymerase primary sigma factor
VDALGRFGFRGTREKVSRPVSMAAPTNRRRLSDTLAARPEGEEGAHRQDELAYLEVRLSALPERERFVIREVYFGAATNAEVGAQLGVSKERVRQIKDSALRRLREAYGLAEAES